jgi:parallel beta-helix repeat protein
MRTRRLRRSISDFRYSPLVAALGLALAPNAGAANVVVVNSPSDISTYDTDTPTITLRGAIDHFNETSEGTPLYCTPAGGDSITFAFSNSAFVSTVSRPLPTIHCDGLTIDGVLANGSKARLVPLSPDLAITVLSSDTWPAGVLVKNIEVDGFTYGRCGTALFGNISSDSNYLHDCQTGLDNNGSFGTSVTASVVQANATGLHISQANATGISYGGDINSVPAGTCTATITGNTITGNGQGLYLQYSLAAVSGNTISGNIGAGILIAGDQGSTLSGNHIGTTSDDSAPQPNYLGIAIGDASGAISFDTVIKNNTISGNTNAGIDAISFSGIHIKDNHIGTNDSGASSLGNGATGILAICGDNLEVSGNTISGNSGNGIILGGVVGTATILSGNKIGVKSDGSTALRNNAHGVMLTTITCPPGGGDVAHIPVATAGVSMPGNLIGFNGGDGINISASSSNSIVGIGDIPDNKIFNNAGYGVNITSGFNNAIVGYLIYGNGGSPVAKNINLGAPGGTLANDVGDADDAVPNHGQNYPDNVVATRSGGQTTVSFTLDTLPGLYRIDVYSNASSAVPGGDTLLFTTTLNVVSPGPLPGSVMVPSVTADHFSLLATRMQDIETALETSEFSSPVANVATVPSVPSVSISPPGLDFGNVAVNTDSPPVTIAITSNGSAPYTINTINDSSCTSTLPICYGGAFTCTTSCAAPHTYNPGDGCQITATFHPTAITNYSTTIAICDNAAPGSPSRTIIIGGSGSGVTPPLVSIIPSAFDFGTTLFRTSSPPHQFTILNPGGSTVSIGPATTTTDFVLNNSTCGTSLAPGASCLATVSFVPMDLGPISGTLSIAAGGISSDLSSKGARKVTSGGPVATSALSGTAVIQAVLDLPTAIDFGAYAAGTPAIRRTVTLRNNGNAVLSPTLSVTGPFVLTNGCPLNMLPGDSCDATLDYSASDLGDHSGTLVVMSNAVGGSRTIPLTAHTVAAPAPQITVSSVSIGFGSSLLGFATSAQRVIITNVGNAPAALSPPAVSTTDFLVSTTCGITLEPTSTCFADVTFRPVGFGPRFGNLLINSNAAGSPNTVSLAGTGCRPFSSSSSRFGTRFGCAP